MGNTGSYELDGEWYSFSTAGALKRRTNAKPTSVPTSSAPIWRLSEVFGGRAFLARSGERRPTRSSSSESDIELRKFQVASAATVAILAAESAAASAKAVSASFRRSSRHLVPPTRHERRRRPCPDSLRARAHAHPPERNFPTAG